MQNPPAGLDSGPPVTASADQSADSAAANPTKPIDATSTMAMTMDKPVPTSLRQSAATAPDGMTPTAPRRQTVQIARNKPVAVGLIARTGNSSQGELGGPGKPASSQFFVAWPPSRIIRRSGHRPFSITRALGEYSTICLGFRPGESDRGFQGATSILCGFGAFLSRGRSESGRRGGGHPEVSPRSAEQTPGGRGPGRRDWSGEWRILCHPTTGSMD
jgi:hypothetical protein